MIQIYVLPILTVALSYESPIPSAHILPEKESRKQDIEPDYIKNHYVESISPNEPSAKPYLFRPDSSNEYDPPRYFKVTRPNWSEYQVQPNPERNGQINGEWWTKDTEDVLHPSTSYPLFGEKVRTLISEINGDGVHNDSPYSSFAKSEMEPIQEKVNSESYVPREVLGNTPVGNTDTGYHGSGIIVKNENGGGEVSSTTSEQNPVPASIVRDFDLKNYYINNYPHPTQAFFVTSAASMEDNYPAEVLDHLKDGFGNIDIKGGEIFPAILVETKFLSGENTVLHDNHGSYLRHGNKNRFRDDLKEVKGNVDIQSGKEKDINDYSRIVHYKKGMKNLSGNIKSNGVDKENRLLYGEREEEWSAYDGLPLKIYQNHKENSLAYRNVEYPLIGKFKEISEEGKLQDVYVIPKYRGEPESHHHHDEFQVQNEKIVRDYQKIQEDLESKLAFLTNREHENFFYHTHLIRKPKLPNHSHSVQNFQDTTKMENIDQITPHRAQEGGDAQNHPFEETQVPNYKEDDSTKNDILNSEVIPTVKIADAKQIDNDVQISNHFEVFQENTPTLIGKHTQITQDGEDQSGHTSAVDQVIIANQDIHTTSKMQDSQGDKVIQDFKDPKKSHVQQRAKNHVIQSVIVKPDINVKQEYQITTESSVSGNVQDSQLEEDSQDLETIDRIPENTEDMDSLKEKDCDEDENYWKDMDGVNGNGKIEMDEKKKKENEEIGFVSAKVPNTSVIKPHADYMDTKFNKVHGLRTFSDVNESPKENMELNSVSSVVDENKFVISVPEEDVTYKYIADSLIKENEFNSNIPLAVSTTEADTTTKESEERKKLNSDKFIVPSDEVKYSQEVTDISSKETKTEETTESIDVQPEVIHDEDQLIQKVRDSTNNFNINNYRAEEGSFPHETDSKDSKYVSLGNNEVSATTPKGIDVTVLSSTSDPAQYHFRYEVIDKKTGDIKKHEEEREGDVIKGIYSIQEPDGTTRTVDYKVTSSSGFQAMTQRNSQDFKLLPL